MSRNEIFKKLQEIFADVFDNEGLIINEKTNAEDIEAWDSITNVSILASVQDEFSVSFEMDEMIAMKNVGDILDSILRKMK